MLTWRCRGGREGVDAALADELDAILGAAPYAYFAIWGRRTREEQAALYKAHLAGGPVAAPPGWSPHEYGYAVDVCVDQDITRPGLQPSWDIRHPGWSWLRDNFPISHPTLLSGWHFGGRRVDPPHIERRGWKHLAGLVRTPTRRSA